MGCRTVSSGNKITNCGSCGEVLLGDAIKVAANLHYHIHCFTCTECGCELVNTGFFTKVCLHLIIYFSQHSGYSFIEYRTVCQIRITRLCVCSFERNAIICLHCVSSNLVSWSISNLCD